MEAPWRRTHEAYGREDALNAVRDGTAWVVHWCGGKVSRSTDSPRDDAGLRYAGAHLIEPAERERLFAKAQRKGHTKTVIMAERWESSEGKGLIVFYETGPYLLPDRPEPDRL